VRSTLFMLFEDTYKTIKAPVEGLFKDRGSKFLAYAYPIEHENEVKALVDNLRKEHFKAVHHCYAYRLGLDRTNFRVNDDGEPSGTAGKPILNTLLSQDITNILVVVVRYFGGTLLGVPGLINAYKSATAEALTVAEVVEKTVNDVYNVSFEFVQMNDVMKIVKEFSLKIRNQTYDNQCTMELEFRKTLTNQVIGKLEKIDGISVEYLMTV
ncbi:MAG: IMPACT family protein, partial [Emticicia sp.]|uniref:IMPACT family protein n=1 Tax=Emticicia sp. TaxID=1930953 RepID=UPI003BA50263